MKFFLYPNVLCYNVLLFKKKLDVMYMTCIWYEIFSYKSLDNLKFSQNFEDFMKYIGHVSSSLKN